MQERIPQSIAKRIVFKAFLAADHVTAADETLTIPVQISKNGGAFANLATPANATHMDPHGSGWYYIQLAIADTDTLGPLVVRGTEGTIDPVELIYEVVAATNAGFTALPAVAAGAASGLPLKDASNFLNVANIPAYTAGATSGLALVGSSMIVPDTQKVDMNTIKTKAVVASNTVTFTNGTVAISGADGDTLKTISDQIDGVVAGSGLTAQQTRDAMKLAPSNGAPIAGSIDAELDTLDTVADAIKVKTDQIGSANVTVTSPVAQSGEITIYIGNDYLLSEGRALTWVVTGVEVAFLDGAAVTLRILRAPLFYRGHEPETLEADAEFEGDVVVANEEATITVELLAADIIELDALRTGYVYQLVAKTTDNTTHTIAAGVFIAVKAIQEPSA